MYQHRVVEKIKIKYYGKPKKHLIFKGLDGINSRN